MGLVAKAIKALPFAGGGWASGSWVQALRAGAGLGGVGVERIATRVGDGSGTSIVEACLNWVCRQFPEAPPAQWTMKPDKTRELIEDSPMVGLLNSPNFDPKIGRSWYGGELLWMATLASFEVDGNAYWYKVRNKFRAPIALWYLPHWLVEPRWPQDGSAFISHYDYRPFGQAVAIDPRDIVHFRWGIDPENYRKGYSQLKGVLQEILTDEEAAAFTATLLINFGMPGVVISPEGEDASVGEDEAEQVKTKFMEKFGGRRRGEPLVMRTPSKLEQFGFSPEQLSLAALRDLPEERVTAALGIPAAVVGFGSGLQEAHTNATYRELREQGWESKLIPLGRILGGVIKDQLAPDFIPEAQLKRTVFGFDLSKVRALQDDENKKAERWGKLVEARIAMVSEARAAFDLDVKKEHQIFLEKISITPVGPGAPELPAPPPTPAPGALPPGDRPALPAPAPQPPKSEEILRELRSVVVQLAADGHRDEQVKDVLRALEKAGAARDETMLKGILEVAKSIASRPIDVAIIEAANAGEIREVEERTETGLVKRVRVTPIKAEHNGAGGSS